MKFRLRSPTLKFCLAIALIFIGANIWNLWLSYRQYTVVNKIEQLGGSWSIAASDKLWLYNIIGQEAMKGFWQIREVHLAASTVTDEDLRIVGRLKNLCCIHLSGTQISDAGLKYLTGFPNLYFLDLSGTQITDAGLETVKEIKTLGYLYLKDTNVTDAGLRHLKELPYLGDLDLTGTKVTDAGVNDLQSVRPIEEIKR